MNTNNLISMDIILDSIGREKQKEIERRLNNLPIRKLGKRIKNLK